MGLRAIVKRGVHPAPLIGGLEGRRAARAGKAQKKSRVRGGATEATGRKEETEIKEGAPKAARVGGSAPAALSLTGTCPNPDGPRARRGRGPGLWG